jgi:hypothetical protein
MQNAPLPGGALGVTTGENVTSSVPRPEDETPAATPYAIEQPRTTEELKAAAGALNVRVKDLHVLGHRIDPFQSDTPSKLRDAEWFAELWQRFGYTNGVHIRRIHYRAQSAGDVALPGGEPYENTDKCHQRLGNASQWARDLGLVDPSKFEDRRNNPTKHYAAQRLNQPEPSGHIELPDVRPWSLPEPTGWDRPWFYGGHLKSLGIGDPDIDHDEIGDVAVSGYDYHRADQPYYEALWIEKSTMDDVLDPLCAELGIDYLVNVGFASKTQAIALLTSASRLGKPLRVFTISDFDPAGAHMPTGLARQLEYYRDVFAPDAEVVVWHLGMHRDWVDKYDLPRAPIKAEDRRKDNFETVHGNGCVELDALEALQPGALAREIRSLINQHRDAGLRDKLAEAENVAESALSDAWLAYTANVHTDLDLVRGEIGEIAERYRSRLTDVQSRRDELMAPFIRRLAEMEREAIDATAPLRDEYSAIVAEYQADIEPLDDRLAELWNQLTELSDETVNDVELPARPEPHISVDESNVLFDSRRHWWDQLQRYRQEKGQEPIDPDVGYAGWTATCEMCGAEFRRLRSDKATCSPACQRRRQRQRRGRR